MGRSAQLDIASLTMMTRLRTEAEAAQDAYARAVVEGRDNGRTANPAIG